MEQVIVGGIGIFSLGVTFPRYNSVYGGNEWFTSEAIGQQLVSSNGKIKSLYVELSGTPGAGKSYAFTLMVNGAASALTCTVSDSSTSASDTTHEVTVSAGDTISLRCIPTGTPTARTARWSVIFEGDTDRESILPAGVATNSKLATRYNALAGVDGWNPGGMEQIIPTPGTLKNLYVKLNTGPGTAPDAYKFTVQVNGVDSALTCTITGAATTGNDTTHEVAVSAWDHVRIVSEPLNSPANNTNVSWGTTFLADTDGESLILGQRINAPITIRYITASQTNMAWDATESNCYQLTQETSLSKLYVEISVAPGLTAYRDFTIRKNGADTLLKVRISDTASTGSDTSHVVNFSDGDEVTLESKVGGIPAANPNVRWGIVLGGPAKPGGGNPIDVLLKNILI